MCNLFEFGPGARRRRKIGETEFREEPTSDPLHQHFLQVSIPAIGYVNFSQFINLTQKLMVFHVKSKCKPTPCFLLMTAQLVADQHMQSSKKYYDLWSLNKNIYRFRKGACDFTRFNPKYPSSVHYLFGWNKKIAYFLNFEVGEQYRH